MTVSWYISYLCAKPIIYYNSGLSGNNKTNNALGDGERKQWLDLQHTKLPTGIDTKKSVDYELIAIKTRANRLDRNR